MWGALESTDASAPPLGSLTQLALGAAWTPAFSKFPGDSKVQLRWGATALKDNPPAPKKP